MKRTVLTLFVITLTIAIIAQNEVKTSIKSGTVYYEQVVKLNIKLEGDAAEFAHALPKERRSKKLLYFNEETALYKNNKTDNENIATETGGMMIKMMEPDNKMFTDLKSKKQIFLNYKSNLLS